MKSVRNTPFEDLKLLASRSASGGLFGLPWSDKIEIGFSMEEGASLAVPGLGLWSRIKRFSSFADIFSVWSNLAR